MKWQDFEQVVTKHIMEENNDPKYFEWSKNGVWQKFYEPNPLCNADVKEIIKFLEKWGKMWRVIGQVSKQMGEDKMYEEFIKASSKIQPLFLSLKILRFEDFQLEMATKNPIIDGKTLKDVIEEIFEEFDRVLKHTIPSKIMHMINPNLFIMWDETIRTSWGCESNCKANARGYACGYYNFMMRMRVELDELADDYARVKRVPSPGRMNTLLDDLNKRIDRNYSITKWLDVYNYTKYHQERDAK